jgi:uncharacterized phage protein gp47/JayE
VADSLYRTPEQYLQDLITALQAGGSRLTDFSIGSATRNFFEAHAQLLSMRSLVLEQLRQDSHLETAVGDALDVKGSDYLVGRLGGVAAAGTVQITRPTSGVAVTIPAGWSELLTQPAPGQQPVSFVTTQDAVFGSGDLTKSVTAIASEPGTAGNIVDQTVLYPTNPVNGFPTGSSFKASGAFSNGSDAELDDAYRDRIKTTVQGRVNGTEAALLSAALGVPGVQSANVLRAGDVRANLTTVAAGQVEVYYEGSAGLLTAVQSAMTNAGVVNQSITVINATLLRLIANCTVYAKTGTDPVVLAAAVAQAMRDTITAYAVGDTVYLSAVAMAVDSVSGVLGVNVPFTDFRKSTDTVGTSSPTIATPANLYPDLQLADCQVTVTLIS